MTLLYVIYVSVIICFHLTVTKNSCQVCELCIETSTKALIAVVHLK